MLRIHIIACCLVALLAACTPIEPLPGGEPIPNSIGGKIAEAINTKRNQPQQCGGSTLNSSPALSWSTPLANAAEKHAQDLISNDRLSLIGRSPQTHPQCNAEIDDNVKGDPLNDPHCGVDGTGVDDRATSANFNVAIPTQFSEIIALTTDGETPVVSSLSDNVDLAVDGWLNSQSHCKQMLRSANTQVGVAALEIPDTSPKEQLWIAVFAGTF